MQKSVDAMNVIVLAAGTSSRMGKTNKLLIPVNSMTMVANTCLEALKFLASQNSKSRLVVVTGYRHASTVKALKICTDYVAQSSSQLDMVIVRNTGYIEGQFTSAKIGVREIPDGEPFFIQLADMPLVKACHYNALCTLLNGNDAVRPRVDGKPGHPVLLSPKLKDIILKSDNNMSVNRILEKCNVIDYVSSDASYIRDVDTSEDVIGISEILTV